MENLIDNLRQENYELEEKIRENKTNIIFLKIKDKCPAYNIGQISHLYQYIDSLNSNSIAEISIDSIVIQILNILETYKLLVSSHK